MKIFDHERFSPYQIFGIRVGATQKEILKAYRTLAMKYHPDRHPEDPEAEDKFKEVQRAYEALSGGNSTREPYRINTSRWGFDDPFSEFSDPFFNFYMLAKKFFFDDQNEESSPKKRRGKGNKR